MSIFVLTYADMQKKPALLTFAYSRKSMEGDKRRWADIIRLTRKNLWLIFVVNFILALMFVAVGWVVIYGEGLANVTGLYSLLILVLLPLVGLVPNLIRLSNVLRGKGYTLRTEQETFKDVLEGASQNMQKAKKARA